MKLNIIFENEDLLVLDKPSGLVVNRAETAKGETLQDYLADYFKLPGGNLGIGDRAGIVHRLDRETSGILLVAKVQKSFDYLQKLFFERCVQKEYTVLVHGNLNADELTIKNNLVRIEGSGKYSAQKQRQSGGRESETQFKVLERLEFPSGDFENIMEGLESTLSKGRINYLKKLARCYTLLRAYPRTGRTHQIRVHLKGAGMPVVSDLIYAPNKLIKFDLLWCPRLFLHAERIEFKMPDLASRSIKLQKFVFESPLPYDLSESLKKLKKLPHG